MTREYSSVRADALADLDFVGVTKALADGRVTAVELEAAARARATEADQKLNAIVSWVPSSPCLEGPFAGVPSLVKDNEAVAGIPTSMGSRATSRRPADHDSAFVAQLRQLGFAVLGTTALPEFGLTASTESLAQGPTRNPWHLDHSTGGSSGGAAAMVAAGVVPIAHTNDGGGSTRIPASCCGLVGLKPSRGRLIPPEGSADLPVPMAEQGVVTRTVRDTALFYSEVEKFHPVLPPIGLIEGPGETRLRIGFFTSGFGGMPVTQDVAAAVRTTAQLCGNLGHHVEEIPFPYDQQLGVDFLRYWALMAFGLEYGGRRLLGPDFQRRDLEPFTKGLSRFFGSVAVNAPASIRRLQRYPQDYQRTFANYDVLLSPVLAQAPPPIGYLAPDLDFDTHIVRLLRYASFTAMQNISGAPAISLPLGRSHDGLPIGVQVASTLGREGTLLELAFELEAATDSQ